MPRTSSLKQWLPAIVTFELATVALRDNFLSADSYATAVNFEW